MWIEESNRQNHAKYGALVYILFLAFSTVLMVELWKGSLMALAATLAVACALEFKDKCWGSKWDWLDIEATVLFGEVITVLVLMITFALNGVG